MTLIPSIAPLTFEIVGGARDGMRISGCVLQHCANYRIRSWDGEWRWLWLLPPVMHEVVPFLSALQAYRLPGEPDEGFELALSPRGCLLRRIPPREFAATLRATFGVGR
jgi:hypothetical protein